MSMIKVFNGFVNSDVVDEVMIIGFMIGNETAYNIQLSVNEDNFLIEGSYSSLEEAAKAVKELMEQNKIGKGFTKVSDCCFIDFGDIKTMNLEERVIKTEVEGEDKDTEEKKEEEKTVVYELVIKGSKRDRTFVKKDKEDLIAIMNSIAEQVG